MDDYSRREAAGHDRAIRFTGTWREYLPIAASNVLLTIVTLGIYRFWATARQRSYLWSRTHLIDDRLEWTGTGKEMFLGFLIVVAVLLPFFLFVQFAFPALVARGHGEAAFGLAMLFYVALLYFGGIARFRALRYRLSRSWWHGIRGGSNDPGWRYGAEYLGRYGLSAMTLLILFPWASTRLWNSRWNRMTFGSDRFEAALDTKKLKRRWALLYTVPFLAAVAAVVGVAGVALGSGAEGEASPAMLWVIVGVMLIFYLAIPLLTLAYFAKFYRKAAGSTRIGSLEFGFDARTWDWLKLYLGNFALALVTLGLGMAFWGYRNWSFMVRHTEVYGNVHLDDFTQTNANAPGEAEGFADAFDVGAF